jgi:transcriptional regulator with XRE-family HTH domain
MVRLTMIGALAWGCKAARVSQGASLAEVAAGAGVSEGVVRRFEQGGTWSDNVEAIVAAYARAVAKRPSELWMEAARATDENT